MTLCSQVFLVFIWVLLFTNSRTARRHWWWQVGRAMRWWWRHYWRQGPLWICKQRYILFVVHFLTQAPNAYGTHNVVVVVAQEKPPEDTDRMGTVIITASPYPHRLHTILVCGGTIWSSVLILAFSAIVLRRRVTIGVIYAGSNIILKSECGPMMDSNSLWMVRSQSNFIDDGARPVPYVQLVSPEWVLSSG